MRGTRLARMINLIRLLQGSKPYGAAALAKFFGISERNVYRDIKVMQLAGVPVAFDREDGGAYRIAPEYFFPPTCLDDEQETSMSILARVSEKRGVPLLDAAITGWEKVLASLPPARRRVLREAAGLFDVLSAGGASQEHARGAMRIVQQALILGRQVDGVYHSPHTNRTVPVSLQPRRVFLGVRENVWYMVAHDNGDEQTKLYRLARFREIKLSRRKLAVPPVADLREYLGNAWSVRRGTAEHDVEVRFTGDAARLVRENRWHPTQKLAEGSDGSLLFRVKVSGFEEIKWWVLGWGPRAQVIGPPELKAEIKRLLQDSLQHYP